MVDRDLRLVPDGNLDTATALIYDSVHAFALALHELSAVQQVRLPFKICRIFYNASSAEKYN